MLWFGEKIVCTFGDILLQEITIHIDGHTCTDPVGAADNKTSYKQQMSLALGLTLTNFGALSHSVRRNSVVYTVSQFVFAHNVAKLTGVSGDSRETMHLFQRVSLAVQRYNSVAFKGTFSVPTELD